jgi:hypothetical protein
MRKKNRDNKNEKERKKTKGDKNQIKKGEKTTKH